MSTTASEQKPHSAAYFGEDRDYWWNADFLELIGKRLQLHEAKSVLDVGCGIGHWGHALAPLLSADAHVTGVDREPLWIDRATERARARGLGERFHYEQGDATSLPFADGTFDLVTCQTVLMHLRDPKQGLREMLRVLAPGGTVLAVEPNNFANRAVGSSLMQNLEVEEVLDRLRFDLMVQRGKEALGSGFNSIGDLIPGYLAESGAENIRVYLCDRAVAFVPPYDSPDQQANIARMRDWTARGFIGWEPEEVRAYFLAGGGTEEELARYHELFLRDAALTLEAIDDGSYHAAGGAVSYLVVGQKPKDRAAARR